MPCPRHDINDCGCPGYPNLVGVLRDCGNNCYEHRHMNRCFRCRAADEIESANRRNRRLIEVICDLQDRLEDSVDQIAVIHPDHPVRLAVVAILAAVATGAAVRVQEALR